jgi:predicted DNA binding protein
MSVILEFRIGSEDFPLGDALSGPEMRLELERVIPTGTMIVPFVWATGENHDAFEETVRTHLSVKELSMLDKVGDSALYEIEWYEPPDDLITGIVEADVVLLEARRNGEWIFRLRFPDHDELRAFHAFVLDHDIPIQVDRTYTPTERTNGRHRFDLSQEQREALALATRRGYFATPREVSLEELTTELGISPQAVSGRIRRGNEKILRQVLLTSASDPSAGEHGDSDDERDVAS